MGSYTRTMTVPFAVPVGYIEGFDSSGVKKKITIPMSTHVEHKTLDVKVSDTITENRSCTYMGVCCDCGLNVFGKDMVDCGCGVRSHCSGHETVSFKRKETTYQRIYQLEDKTQFTESTTGSSVENIEHKVLSECK